MMFTDSDYAQLSGLPLSAKIVHAQERIRQWYEHYDGQVYVSFSGGKASEVLLYLVRELYPDVEAVFVDTSNEWPEVRQYATTISPLTILRPKRDFRKIISEYGYPVISKRVARVVRYAQQGKPWALNALDNKFASGDIKTVGRMKKWKFLVDAPYKVSDICCDITKHQPIRAYEKSTGKHPYIGLQACESMERKMAWKEHGCNSYDTKTASSKPLSIWTDDDIWKYIKGNCLGYCKLYDLGYTRTGCCYCMFGIQFDKTPNRFQRMRQTHPKLFEYCMRPTESNGLGLQEVLKHLGVDTSALPEQTTLW